MNIVDKLTLRQLKLNRKRTIVTIMGSIISVAMITAVCTLGISFLDLMQRVTIAEEGEWHVIYRNVNKEQLEAIKNDEETKTVVLSRDTGYSFLRESQNPNKPYIFIREYNKHGFEKFPVSLKEGRFPENPDEVIISDAIITNGKAGYKIGDVLTLEIGQRYSAVETENSEPFSQNIPLQKNKDGVQEILTRDKTRTCTVVGIMERPSWEPAWSPGYTVLSYVDESYINSTETINASVIVKKVDAGIFEHVSNLALENGIGEYFFNNSLLRYYGVISDNGLRKTLFTLSSVIMSIIIAGSITLIYNAFAISVSDRSRYLGMLSSVGATKIQKRNSVFFEGMVISAISIPAGIIAGLGGIGITFRLINPTINNVINVTENMRVVVFPSTIILAVLISFATILISTWIPAIRASNISAIDAIRQTMYVKLTGKEVKTSKLTRLIFGIEGDIALKNLKRNKGRYKTTIFSLVISIVLFLVVSQFTLDLKKSLSLAQDEINFDIAVSFGKTMGEKKENIIDKIIALENITSATEINILEAVSPVDINQVPDFLKDDSIETENGKINYHIYINALDSGSLEKYVKEVGIDIKRLMDVNNPSAIVINTAKRIEDNRFIENIIVELEKEDIISVEFSDNETNKNIALQPLQAAALTNKAPMGIVPLGGHASFHVIVSEDVLERIASDNKNAENSLKTELFFKSNNPMKLQEGIESIQNTLSEESFDIYNLYLQNQKQEQLVSLMSVFTYGFIALISAICIANILNTITTSINLRKREFAMLKSVGMTPGSFNKMINYESLFYGLKAVSFSLPVSFALMYFIHRIFQIKFSFMLSLPWTDVFIAVISVFVIVGIAMLYSAARLKNENIIDVLKQEIM